MQVQLKHRFGPIKIKPAEVKTRIIMPAMATRSANPDGSPIDRLNDYYEARPKAVPLSSLDGSLIIAPMLVTAGADC